MSPHAARKKSKERNPPSRYSGDQACRNNFLQKCQQISSRENHVDDKKESYKPSPQSSRRLFQIPVTGCQTDQKNDIKQQNHHSSNRSCDSPQPENFSSPKQTQKKRCQKCDHHLPIKLSVGNPVIFRKLHFYCLLFSRTL